jgi:hypothetical protein
MITRMALVSAQLWHSAALEGSPLAGEDTTKDYRSGLGFGEECNPGPRNWLQRHDFGAATVARGGLPIFVEAFTMTGQSVWPVGLARLLGQDGGVRFGAPLGVKDTGNGP